MLRVLQVYPQLNNAGTEMVIMNLYRNIDREKLQFDFLVQKSGELDETVKAMGANVYIIPKTNDYKNQVYKFFAVHSEYSIVHTHTHAEMGLVLKIAKKSGVKIRIAHSHNYRGDMPKIFKLYKMLSSFGIEQNANKFLACSEEAAAWLFPRKYKQATVWNNAIDLDRFLFSKADREEYRNRLSIPQNARVCCNVGRFAEQKNHKRIIELFNELCDIYDDFYGILVGVGPLLEEIKAKSKSDRILFLGNRTDVPQLLSASDTFLFPSLYEGLGIVAVEAQASGLMCIASSSVPKAADIGTELFVSHNLNEDNEIWLDSVISAFNNTDLSLRQQKSKMAFESDYNIKKVALKAQNFYLNFTEKTERLF